MRRAVLVLGFAALLPACASGAPLTHALAPATPASVFGCGMRQIGALGYVVAEADRSAGRIRAERDQSGRRDQLTVTISQLDGGRTLLRVVPAPSSAPRRTSRDIQVILRACGNPR